MAKELYYANILNGKFDAVTLSMSQNQVWDIRDNISDFITHAPRGTSTFMQTVLPEIIANSADGYMYLDTNLGVFAINSFLYPTKQGAKPAKLGVVITSSNPACSYVINGVSYNRDTALKTLKSLLKPVADSQNSILAKLNNATGAEFFNIIKPHTKPVWNADHHRVCGTLPFVIFDNVRYGGSDMMRACDGVVLSIGEVSPGVYQLRHTTVSIHGDSTSCPTPEENTSVIKDYIICRDISAAQAYTLAKNLGALK